MELLSLFKIREGYWSLSDLFEDFVFSYILLSISSGLTEIYITLVTYTC